MGQVVQTMSSIHQSSAKKADIIGVIDGSPSRPTSRAQRGGGSGAGRGTRTGFAVVATEGGESLPSAAQRRRNQGMDHQG